MEKVFAEDFTLRHRLTAAVSRRLQGVVYTSRGGLTSGLRRKGGLGFLPAFAHANTAENRFLRSLDLRGKTAYDIGGFQGLMSIFFAKTAEHVITFEANPTNVVRIYENAGLNGFKNIFVIATAIGTHDGILNLCMDPTMTGAASGDPEISKQIRTEVADIAEFAVVQTSIDSAVQRYGLDPPDFVKIDIEGMELDALQGMESTIDTHKPDLYLELHGTTPANKLANATNAIDFIRGHGYKVFDVEQGRDITADTPTGRESHIYCQSLKA